MSNSFSDNKQLDNGPDLICPKCHSVTSANAKFCGIDGSALDKTQRTSQEREQVNRCPICSRTFPQHARFCASDGSALTAQEGTPIRQHQQPYAGRLPQKQIDARPTIADPGYANLNLALKAEAAQALASQPTSEVNQEQRLIGTKLDGKYLIEAVIAEGGMATLFRATQLGMERRVAVKVMLPSVAANSKATDRFAQECKLAARLNHPNIVSVYDVGFVSSNEPYLVMEYIDGQSLAQELALKGPPPLDVAANIFTQVLKGLEEAHGAGIVHRDLKPDNILLQRKANRSDWVKIVDFGIANLADNSKRLTKVGAFIGTPTYMAPEQFKSKPLDLRVDLYSLGIVIFETLTGTPPFDGENAEAIIMQHLMEEPPDLLKLRPDAPQCLDLIIKKALAKEPNERFQNPIQFRQALETCFQGGS